MANGKTSYGMSPYAGAAMLPDRRGQSPMNVNDLLMALGVGLLGNARGKDWGGGIAQGLTYANDLATARRQEERQRRGDELTEQEFGIRQGQYGLQQREFSLKEQEAQAEIERQKRLGGSIRGLGPVQPQGLVGVEAGEPASLTAEQVDTLLNMSPDAQENFLADMMAPKEPRNVQYEKRREDDQEVTYRVNADGSETRMGAGAAFAPQQPKEPNARQQKIEAGMRHYGMDEATATKYADGMIHTTPPDATGNVSIIDLTTRKVIGGFNPEDERARTREAELNAAPALDGGAQKAEVMSYEDAAIKSVGIVPQAARVATGALGAVGGRGEVAPESAAAQRRIAQVNTQIKSLLIPDGKPSNYEQQTVDKILIDPKAVFDTPEQAQRQAAQLRSFFAEQQANYQRMSVDTTIPVKERGAAATSAANYGQALKLLGPASGAVPDFTGMSDEDVDANVDRLAVGAKYIGPDGKTYVVEK